MNWNAHILSEFHGKTVERVEYSNEMYEDTWIKVHFTDGTIYLIEAKLMRVDELTLEVTKH